MFDQSHCSAPTWFEPYRARGDIPPVRKTLYRNNKVLEGQHLPTVSVSNMRSLLPKVNSYKNDILEREISLSLLSEVWEVKGKKKHKLEIERMLELDGLKYISTPRSFNKRGGGCAIVANLQSFTMEKIDVLIPSSVEVVYGFLRAKNPAAKFKEIIAVAFYSPPNSRKINDLLDHMITTCHVLLTKHPNAALFIGGDRNKMSITPMLISIPKLRQLVTKNTCNGKVLDVLLTNVPEYFSILEIVPAVSTDNPDKGCPSDHSTVVATPQVNCNVVAPYKNEYVERISRPIPESGKLAFGQWLVEQNWDCIEEEDNPTKQALKFEEILTQKLDIFLPTKKVRVTVKDKSYINADIKKLDRLKKREYRKHGRSEKYLKLRGKN